MSPDQVPPATSTARATRSRRLSIEAQSCDGEVRVNLRGELDLGSAPTFRREMARLEATQPVTLRINLSGLRFVDSTGLSLLVELYHRCLAARCALWLTPAAPAAQRMFELTLLNRTLPFAEPDGSPLRPAQSPPD